MLRERLVTTQQVDFGHEKFTPVLRRPQDGAWLTRLNIPSCGALAPTLQRHWIPAFAGMTAGSESAEDVATLTKARASQGRGAFAMLQRNIGHVAQAVSPRAKQAIATNDKKTCLYRRHLGCLPS